MEFRKAVGQLGLRHAVGFTINFSGSVYLARSLGPESWGTFAIAAVGLAIGQQLVERGAVGYLVQRAAVVTGRDLSTALTVQATLGVVLTALLAAVAPQVAIWYAYPDLQHLTTAAGIALFAYALRAIPVGYLERSMNYGHVAAVELLDVLAFNAVAVAGTAAGFGLGALSAAILARSLASLVAAYLLARVPQIRPGFSTRALREMGGFAAPYALANGVAWANTAAAPILVGTFVGTREFGVLQMSFTLLGYPQVLTAIIGRVALPLYARVSDVELLTTRVQSGTIALARYLGGITLLLAVTSVIWVPVLYGEQWVGMSKFMLVIAPVYALERTFALVIAALSASGRVIAILLISLAFSLIYWTLGATLIPRLGAIGLPIAYALASVSFISYIAVYRRTVARLNVTHSMLEFTALASLLVIAAVWSVAGGQTIGIAVVAFVMTALILRNVPLVARLHPTDLTR